MMEIYFSDLTPDAQKRLLATAGISDPKEANWETSEYEQSIYKL